MRVLKRDNTYEAVSFDKVLRRIQNLCNDLAGVSPDEIAQSVCGRIFDGVKTSELDELAAQLCASMLTVNPDYGTLAARIIISNHHKNTSPSFSETMTVMYNTTDAAGNRNPLISEELWQIVQTHRDKLNSIIDYNRDYDFSYFGFKTLERSYLSKVKGKTVERPQHMWMRVALGIHGWDVKEAIETYNGMSQRRFTHATPTLFNAGTSIPSLSSCFLLGLDDSITGIYKNISDCALISKTAGGIGIHVHNIRARNSYIRGTNGTSSGIIPMLRVYNETAKYVNQCFRGDTLVYTFYGPKYIQDVQVGDKVLTSDSTYKPVLSVFKNEVSKDVLKISTEWSSRPVYVTPEHQVFTLDTNLQMVEVSASSLTTDSLMGYPNVLTLGAFAERTCHGMNWVRIKDIETVKHEGFVYDLNVEDNHNYTTDIGLVHNSGRRNGSIAVYLEPWHADIEAFLDLRKNSGNEEERCRDLFTAMWIPDLFMRTVESNGDWYIMCPDECPGLSDVHGEAFDELYMKYVEDGKYRKKMKAQHLWLAIIRSQIETGTPYILFKDSANKKCNQKNLGTIKSSNLCSEVVLYSDDKEYASCNLASLSLPAFVRTIKNEDGTERYEYDFEGLQQTAQIVCRNLNKVIDKSYYAMKETEINNKKHRPLGIGVTGLADVFAMMRYPFDSAEAAKLNIDIFESIYYGCAVASMLIAKRRAELRDELDVNTEPARKEEILKYLMMTAEEEALTEYRGAYVSFKGSPAEQGQMQYDLWNWTPSDRWNWQELKDNIKMYGLRNSMLTTCMPSASTSQIIGNNESIEPITSNAYVRETLAGNFYIINKYLVNDLIRLGLWNESMKNRILAGSGSIQHISEIPDNIKALYKTSFELKQKVLIDQSADRGPYICQSQSLNLFMEDPDFARVSNAHFYSWRRGLKTGCYYLRSRPKAKMSAYTLEASTPAAPPTQTAGAVCRRDDPTCLACSA